MGKFGKNTQIVSHNAFSETSQSRSRTSTIITTFYYQQRLNITAQLDAGARALMLDVYLVDDNGRRVLTLCHGRCTPLMYRNLTETLIEVVAWMQDSHNRNEIISIFIEDHVPLIANDLYNQSLTDSGSYRLTIPSSDSRALGPTTWFGPQQPRYLVGSPRDSDDISSLVTSNQRLFFYVDRNMVGTSSNQTTHALPFIWHHFRESSFEDQSLYTRIQHDWFGQPPLQITERSQSLNRGINARNRTGRDPRTMTLVNHFSTLPPQLDPDTRRRERIIDTVCNYFNTTGTPPTFIAVDGLDFQDPSFGVANELNSQVWNQSNQSTAMRSYCARNNVNSAVGLMAAFPLSLLIGFGMVAIFGLCVFGYNCYQWCRTPRQDKKD